MKNSNNYRFFIALISIILTCNLFGDFVDLGVGARQQGLGNVFVGICDDITSIYYNPSGLGLLKRGEVIVDYSRLYLGLDDGSNLNSSFIGGGYPLKFEFKDKEVYFGVFGIGWYNFSLSGIYQENVIYLSYGREILDKFSIGGNIKFLTEEYTQDLYTRIDPVFNYGRKNSIQNFALDISGLYNFMPRFFVGVNIINLNEPEIGLKEKESLNRTIKLGVGYKDKKTTAGIDFVSEKDNNSFGLGAEQNILNKHLFLRTGLEIGTKEYRKISLGMSYSINILRLDYSFSLPLAGIKDVYGTHKISLMFKFGRTPTDEIEPGSLEEAYYKLRQEIKKTKEELEKTEKERENLEKALLEEATRRTKERIREIKTESSKEISPPPTTKPLTSERQTITPITTPKYHTVDKTDTLQSIAQKYYGDADKWYEIYNANKEKIGRGGSLTVGQILTIPPVSSTTQQESIIQPLKPQQEQQQIQPLIKPQEQPKASQRTYVVQQGDTLLTIAEKIYGNSRRWVDIYKANKDKIPRGTVEPGQVLIIPE